MGRCGVDGQLKSERVCRAAQRCVDFEWGGVRGRGTFQ